MTSGPSGRSRGVIALDVDRCTSCMICVRECPDWCIEIDAHQEVTPAGGLGGRSRTRNVLDRFEIDYALCMYCGICVDVCPYDALHWAPRSTPDERSAHALVHDAERLAVWLDDVPDRVGPP